MNEGLKIQKCIGICLKGLGIFLVIKFGGAVIRTPSTTGEIVAGCMTLGFIFLASEVKGNRPEPK